MTRLRVGELCAGYGGLGLGLETAGVPVEVAWWSEISDRAAAVMAAHTSAPNLGDLTELAEVPPVDIVTAGFPCQPVSVAGQGKGIDDERWLIRDVVDVWKRSGARWLLLENVPGLLSANDGEAFGQVIDALAEVGTSAEWACLRASDVGAPHRRERWFCVVDAGGTAGRPAGIAVCGDSAAADRGRAPSEPRGCGGPAADADDEGPQGPQSATGRFVPPWGGGPAADADDEGHGRVGVGGVLDGFGSAPGDDVDGRHRARFGRYAVAVARWELILGRPAPDPTVGGRLSDVFVEWMMGLPAGWVTGVGLSRRQALGVLGNGVVPLQAAAAVRVLSDRLTSI